MIFDTRKLQHALAALGFDPGPADGILGPRTEAAIIAFKRSIGLRPRPYVGPLTWAALMRPAPASEMPWLDIGAAIKGLHEARDLGRLRAWFSPVVAWIDPREIPWCGAFVATCLRRWDPGVVIPKNPLGARNWGDFGLSSSPQLGAVLTFSRPGPSWAGHVGFYWGEDEAAYHVLGGNQSNAVTVTRIAKRRLLAARWPAGHPQPRRRIFLDRAGRPLSQNEA